MSGSAIAVCCRSEPEGGDIDEAQALDNARVLYGQQHVIFLVHGYNNTAPEACASYRAFCALQAQRVNPGQDWAFGAAIASFYWPGDARWGIARPAYYPWAIPAADGAAAILAKVLVDLLAHTFGELTVDFVAHSLGNRLVLRTIALLSDRPGLNIRRVVHMAAAVATWKLDSDERDHLRTGMLDELSPGFATSLYSSDDLVLADVFPIGETVDVVHEGIAPIALGHAKWVGGDSIGLGQSPATGAVHHDYWGGNPDTRPDVRDEIQSLVHDALSLGVEGRRQIPSHVAQVSAPSEVRLLDVRETETRVSGDELIKGLCDCAT